MSTGIVALGLLALSASSELQLNWQAPEECMQGAEVRAEVVKALGRPLSTGGTQLKASATVVLDDGAYVLDVRLDAGAGTSERQLWADSCDTVTEALAVIVALALDDPEVERPPLRVPVIARSRTRPAPLAATATVSAGVRVDVGASVDLGLLPRSGLGLEATFGYARPQWRLAGGGLLRLPRNRDVDPGTVNAQLAAALVVACWVPKPAKVTFEGCLGTELGQMRASGSGFDTDEEAQALWWAARLGVALSARLAGPLGVRVHLDGLIPITRPVLAVEEGSGALRSVYRVPGFAAGLGFGLFVDFS